jgi:predicted transcriptional regulator of viral defense system
MQDKSVLRYKLMGTLLSILGDNMTLTACKNAIEIIRSNGGMIRTAVAIKIGIRPRTLYALRDNGTVERISRGVYRLAELAAISN